jgi:hypothetical protein
MADEMRQRGSACVVAAMSIAVLNVLSYPDMPSLSWKVKTPMIPVRITAPFAAIHLPAASHRLKVVQTDETMETSSSTRLTVLQHRNDRQETLYY